MALAYVIVTSVHVIAGEQVPKIYAIVKAETVARHCARPLGLFELAMRPLIGALNGAANGILRLMRIDPDNAVDEGGTPEDFKLLITQARTGGKLDPGEAGMLAGVFHLHEQEARQVMTPIPAVVTVDVSDDVETALRRCVSSGHTRLVVTEDESPDRVRGTMHANSLARIYMAEGPGGSIESLVKPALIVPETKPLDDLLADLQRERSSLAVVVDEYGRTAGIVTVEDIVEEVVGEIDDETDPAGGAVRRLANGDWFVRGHVAIERPGATTESSCRSTPTPTTRSAASSSPSSGGCPKRGDAVRRRRLLDPRRVRAREPDRGGPDPSPRDDAEQRRLRLGDPKKASGPLRAGRTMQLGGGAHASYVRNGSIGTIPQRPLKVRASSSDAPTPQARTAGATLTRPSRNEKRPVRAGGNGREPV